LLKESIENGNTFTINKTEGDSMWPLISKEDTIHIKYKKFDNLNIGDIILFESSEFVLHRITKIIDNKIVTKGDNNKKKDYEIITEKNYIGILYKINKKRRNITIKEPFLTLYFKYLLPLHFLSKILLKKL